MLKPEQGYQIKEFRLRVKCGCWSEFSMKEWVKDFTTILQDGMHEWLPFDAIEITELDAELVEEGGR